MEVKTAKSAGFCFGVKRAVEKAYEVAGEKKSGVYTYCLLYTSSQAQWLLPREVMWIPSSRQKIQENM